MSKSLPKDGRVCVKWLHTRQWYLERLVGYWKAFQWSPNGQVEKIHNIMVAREFIILCAIKHNSGSPIYNLITIGNFIWQIRSIIMIIYHMLMSNIISNIIYTVPFMLAKLIDK